MNHPIFPLPCSCPFPFELDVGEIATGFCAVNLHTHALASLLIVPSQAEKSHLLSVSAEATQWFSDNDSLVCSWLTCTCSKLWSLSVKRSSMYCCWMNWQDSTKQPVDTLKRYIHTKITFSLLHSCDSTLATFIYRRQSWSMCTSTPLISTSFF